MLIGKTEDGSSGLDFWNQWKEWYIITVVLLAVLQWDKQCDLQAGRDQNVTTVMELVNHKARTMLLCPLYSPAHLDIRSGNRGFSP